MKTRTMTRTQAELLLAAVIIARSTSYVLTKVGLQDMGKFTLLAVRFLLAFAFLAALFRRRLLQIDRRTLLSGLAMGGIYFLRHDGGAHGTENRGDLYRVVRDEHGRRHRAAHSGGAQPPLAGAPCAVRRAG